MGKKKRVAKKSKKEAKKKANKAIKKAGKKIIKKVPALEIPKDTPALEIYIGPDGLITALRATCALAYRIIDLGLEENEEAPAVAVGYVKEGGETTIPQYDKEYMKICGEVLADG